MADCNMKCKEEKPSKRISFFIESGVKRVGKYKTLALRDRKLIADMYAKGNRAEDIAAKIGASPATVYRELDRGATGELDDNQRPVYDAKLGERAYQDALRRRGRRRKVADRIARNET